MTFIARIISDLAAIFQYVGMPRQTAIILAGALIFGGLFILFFAGVICLIY